MPKGAPNVLLIMGDDIGYGHMSAFGGPANTPTFHRLAKKGLIFTNFHTTPVCSASRAALITGRNAHSVGMGIPPEGAIGFPGYNAVVPRSAATFWSEKPTLVKGNKAVCSPGTVRLVEDAVIDVKNRSFSITVDVDNPDGKAEGMLVTMGGESGGPVMVAAGQERRASPSRRSLRRVGGDDHERYVSSVTIDAEVTAIIYAGDHESAMILTPYTSSHAQVG